MLQLARSRAGVRSTCLVSKHQEYFRTVLSELTTGASHSFKSKQLYFASTGDENSGANLRKDSLVHNLIRYYCGKNPEVIGMDLQQVTDVLKSMASPSLAGSWDNVGLLLEPSLPHTVQRMLLTNDLTPAVMKEAVDHGVNMIVSYHPPIFAPLKRVTQSSWKERIVAGCLERRIALYSPHTSWDAAVDGVNDWLIHAFDVSEVRPVEQTEQTEGGRNKRLVFVTPSVSAKTVAELPLLKQNPGIKVYTKTETGQPLLETKPGTEVHTEPLSGVGGGGGKIKVCIQCSAANVPAVLAAMVENHVIMENVECTDVAKLPLLGYGMGRVGQLRSPITMETAVAAIKKHLNLPHVRLAQSAEKTQIRTVAVCAGSGASVLGGVKADLYLTGEMSHHEVLDAVCKGTSVVLCDHSNTERGFLKVVQGRLKEKLGNGVEVIVSETDRDPLVVV
ncbi:NIF3-like protein 1 [Littorina saxatilis]|uniref:NIF3-like protein 1 n=1 Tax=Littorina saxatilis TaxID=31220 RepID=UPI0038B582E9